MHITRNTCIQTLGVNCCENVHLKVNEEILGCIAVDEPTVKVWVVD